MKTILPALKLTAQVIGYTLMVCVITALYFTLFACCDNLMR